LCGCVNQTAHCRRSNKHWPSSIRRPFADSQRSSRILGIAHAQQGNVQFACKFAIQALAITTQTKSLSVLERVRQVWKELEAWKDTEEVKDLERYLETTSVLIAM